MLEGKRHQWELSETDMLTVNVDAVQMGVGGDNSWGLKPHDKYMPGAGEYRLAFVVRGLKDWGNLGSAPSGGVVVAGFGAAGW